MEELSEFSAEFRQHFHKWLTFKQYLNKYHLNNM